MQNIQKYLYSIEFWKFALMFRYCRFERVYRCTIWYV